ncbi:MAG: DUF4440 domain-containing protein [Bacteroidota bacterium]
MYQIKIFITMLLAVHMFSIAKAQNQDAMKSVEFSPEQLEVLNAVEKMTSAFHSSDIEGVMNSYEPNAVVVFEPELPVTDAKALQTMFQGAFMANPVFTYSGHEVFINGDIAMHLAPWTMTGQTPDGTKIEQSGLSIAILRKQENGEWLMIFDNPHGSFLMNKN